MDLSQTYIGLGDCNIVLADAIKHNSSITHLNLSSNPFGLGDCTALAEAIKQNSTIRQLDLSGTNCGICDRYMVLADAVKHNSTITHLNLSCNSFGLGDCTALAEVNQTEFNNKAVGFVKN